MVLIHVFSVFIAYAFLDCLPVLARQGFILVNGAVVMGMAGQSGDVWAKWERFLISLGWIVAAAETMALVKGG